MDFPFGPSAIMDSISPTAPVMDALKGLTGGDATSSASSGLTSGDVGGTANFSPVSFGAPSLGSSMLSTQNLVIVGALLLLGYVVYKKVQ